MPCWRISLCLVFAGLCFADAGSVTVRGKLTQKPGQPPAIETSDHKFIPLDGDVPTQGVLKDKRLAGADLEVRGHYTSGDAFTVDPMHTKAMFVYKDGKKSRITYWCDLCSIRTYTPGICMCCQQETALDLRDPDKE